MKTLAKRVSYQPNRDLRIERALNGKIIVARPAGSGSRRQNLRLAVRLEKWSDPSDLPEFALKPERDCEPGF